MIRGIRYSNAVPVHMMQGLSVLTSVNSLQSRRLAVDIPMGFTEMLRDNPELALAWRICTRAIFTTYFDRGYKAVDFLLDRAARRGTYLLVRRT